MEKYPPVMNLLRCLAREIKRPVELHVISTHPANGKALFREDGITIHRVAAWNGTMNKAQRMMLYFRFNVRTLLLLYKKRPSKLLYYETLSAGGPGLYKNWFAKQVELYIHYHEYTSPGEYKHGMILNRWLHSLEKKIYKKAVWISHTNEYRVDLFKKDIGVHVPAEVHSLPNYPPQSWKHVRTQKHTANKETRFVYVGALSTETMYVKEFASFIEENPSCRWDIYSDNFSDDVLQFVGKREAYGISFKGAIAYDSLPVILPQYDVGVILYKGHIPNYVYNAPNKLFEYLACGIDVWFPKEMIGSIPYVRSGVRPEVCAVNFEDLPQPPFEASNQNKIYVETDFFAETSLRPLIEKLLCNAG